MEGAKHRLVRSEGTTRDPHRVRASLPKAVPRLGGSRHAPRTRSASCAEPPATRSGRRARETSGTVAIPLTAESAPAAAALIDGDQMLIAELREAENTEVEGGMVAAEGGRKGKRAEYRCAACGYGIVVYAQPPGCPICSETSWEHVEWRPFSQRQPALAAVAG
jgi:hypothetical protein